MSDPRLTPANARVAHENLRGHIHAPHYTSGTWHKIAVGVVDILDDPNGKRARQTLYGERVLVLENHDGYAFVHCEKDGYVGYIPSASLGADAQATHWVSALGTHLYPAADFKQNHTHSLSFGARVTVVDSGVNSGANSASNSDDRFVKLDTGLFVPQNHISPVGRNRSDFVASAKMFLGTPYVWGGNSRDGIDCSGLAQAALIGAGHPCPGDSDQQMELGTALEPTAPLKRGDLLFWKGHIAIVVDQTTLIHATVSSMNVCLEPILDAITRIQSQGDGPVTARRRLKQR